MKTTIIIALLFVGGWCQAQSDTISVSERIVQWKSSAFIDLITNVRVETANIFIFNKGQSIEWIQSAENARLIFIIKERKIQWNRLIEDGEIEYDIEFRGNEGKLIIKRALGKLSLGLEIPDLRTGPMSLKFEIDQAY